MDNLEQVSNLEQLCTENPEIKKSKRALLVNHYAKRAYELPIVIASLVPAILASTLGAVAVKLEDAYMVSAGKAKISRIFANPFYTKKTLMSDGSLRSQWKLRSMEPDANSKYHQMVEQRIIRPGDRKQIASKEVRYEGTGNVAELSNHIYDPRVTVLGKWLRKFSTDESPQLLQLMGQYLGKGLLYSPDNLYFFGNRPQSPEAIENAQPEDQAKLRQGPWGLFGLDHIGRGRLGHDKETNNNHRYSQAFFGGSYVGPTDWYIFKNSPKIIFKGTNG